MVTFAEGIEFDTIAREWRCKWSADNDKASLVEAQKVLDSVLDSIKNIDGFKKVDRVVCGGCLDFKVIISMPVEKWEAWSEKKFAPEEEFMEKLKAIQGISQVETQNYTFTQL
mmetsp:Transcript_26226/g.36959  ORF Transcript_26226/g.36959 Transcript_26226/m.36959 type:complete len:113 (-) Transcript_26226:272-610(-)